MPIAEDYSTTSKINAAASSNYITLPSGYQVVTPSRSNGSTYLSEQFDSLSAWTKHTGSDATITDVASGFPDPAIGNVAKFYTGTGVGVDCRLDKTLTSLPTSYSLALQASFPGNLSTSPSDSFVTTFQNTVDNKYLQILQNNHSLLVGHMVSGSLAYYQPIDPSSYGPYWEQWWKNADNGDGSNTISLYAGTEFVTSNTILLPTGSPSTKGLVELQQNSNVQTGLIADVGVLNIGVSQFADNITLTSTAYTTTYGGTGISFLAFVENTDGSLVVNTDYMVDISINNGSSWVTPTLTDIGEFCKGSIDYTKSVRIFEGVVTESIPLGSKVIFRQRSANNKLFALHGYDYQIPSTY